MCPLMLCFVEEEERGGNNVEHVQILIKFIILTLTRRGQRVLLSGILPRYRLHSLVKGEVGIERLTRKVVTH